MLYKFFTWKSNVNKCLNLWKESVEVILVEDFGKIMKSNFFTPNVALTCVTFLFMGLKLLTKLLNIITATVCFPFSIFYKLMPNHLKNYQLDTQNVLEFVFIF